MVAQVEEANDRVPEIPRGRSFVLLGCQSSERLDLGRTPLRGCERLVDSFPSANPVRVWSRVAHAVRAAVDLRELDPRGSEVATRGQQRVCGQRGGRPSSGGRSRRRRPVLGAAQRRDHQHEHEQSPDNIAPHRNSVPRLSEPSRTGSPSVMEPWNGRFGPSVHRDRVTTPLAQRRTPDRRREWRSQDSPGNGPRRQRSVPSERHPTPARRARHTGS